MKKVIFIILTLALFYSCKKDFNINAEWKDIPITYCLLNPSDSLQYIRIQRAFLGNGNAIQMSSIPDSTFYPTGTLEVKIERWLNGVYKSTIYARDTIITNKDAGAFPYPNQKIYYFNSKDSLNKKPNPYHIDINSVYKLVITNKKTNKVTSASTLIVDNSSIDYPSPFLTVDFSNDTNTAKHITWYTARNGRTHECVIRFWYVENNTEKYVDWNIGIVTSLGLDGNEKYDLTYYGNLFYKNLGEVIPVNASVTRKMGRKNNSANVIDIIIAVASEDLTTYIGVYTPSNSIVQDKPAFTNITGGLGIFSSRNLTITSYDMPKNSKDWLKTCSYTKNLNFQ